MSNLTTSSTVLASIVLSASVALSVTLARASVRVGDVRLRYISAGFAVLAVKHAVSIYTIQVPVLHHEVTEMIGTLFDVALVACMAAPIYLARRL